MRHKVSFAISAASSVLLVAFYVARRPAPVPPPPAVPAALPPVPKYALCKEIDAFVTRLIDERQCVKDTRGYLRSLCRASFEEREECKDELETAFACASRVPERWICDFSGALALPPDVCKPELEAWAACMK